MLAEILWDVCRVLVGLIWFRVDDVRVAMCAVRVGIGGGVPAISEAHILLKEKKEFYRIRRFVRGAAPISKNRRKEERPQPRRCGQAVRVVVYVGFLLFTAADTQAGLLDVA